MDRHPIEVLMDKGAEKKWPVMLHFDLTYKCNQRCIHCYVVRQNRGELSSSEIKQTLIELANAKSFLLTLSGGEIFVRDDIFDIISTASKLNFRTVILSNGTLITPGIAKLLKKFNIAEVHISIYSTAPEQHDKITRTKDSFKKTLRGIDLLLEQGIRVVIKTQLMKQTFDEYRRIKLFADKLGADYLFGPTIFPKMDFDKKATYLSPTIHQIEKLYLDMGNFALKGDLEEVKKRAEKFIISESNLSRPLCGAGWNRCYISPYGDVFPCNSLLIPIGNLRQNNFREIWDNSPLLGYIRNIDLKMMVECLHCMFLPYCNPCPGVGYQGTGNLFKPYKLHCRVTKAKFKAIKKTYYSRKEVVKQ